MHGSLFEQLNQLTPNPGVSPTNGQSHDRSDQTLSFPCDSSALTAQLEAWTNVAFDFDSPDFGDAAGDDCKTTGASPAEDRATVRYAAAFSAANALKYQHESPAQSTISPELTSSVDLSALLGHHTAGANSSSFSADPFAPSNLTSGSLVDPALSLPAFGASSSAAPTFPSFFAAPTPGSTSALLPPLPETPAVEAAPAPAAKPAKGKKAAAASEKKKRAAPTKAAKAAAVVAPLPLPEGVNTDGMTDDQLNSLAIEEDKRRRNTAASARFRVKKKQREQALEQSAKELKERVAVLEKEVETLRTENGWLRGLIVDKTIDMGMDGAGNNRKRAREDDEHTIDPSSILV
ncbi:hypothetical protein JCM10207_003114 [Rhodosporidiobolus poonsookiae]